MIYVIGAHRLPPTRSAGSASSYSTTRSGSLSSWRYPARSPKSDTCTAASLTSVSGPSTVEDADDFADGVTVTEVEPFADRAGR